jgi:Na+/H+ antiporter NhaD/arsenite permease-like protein
MQPTPDVLWGVTFAGMLLSIALFPAVAPRFWHRRMGAVATLLRANAHRRRKVHLVVIFITIQPVMGMLHAGLEGPLAPLLRLARDEAGEPIPLAFFWLSGVLSAFLHNAATYLSFFELTGDDPVARHGDALQALSAGAVFFGGVTYIGSAQNLMLRAIAAHRGVHMSGFFTFTGYAALVLLPVFALLSLLFFL